MFRNQKGQSLLEFAIVLPLLILIVSGVLDLGRLYFTHIAMEDGVGDAALYLAVFPGCVDEADIPTCDYPDSATNRARNALSGPLLDMSDATITAECFDFDTKVELDCKTQTKPGDIVQVTMSNDFQLLTPVIRTLNGNAVIRLKSEATQLVLVP